MTMSFGKSVLVMLVMTSLLIQLVSVVVAVPILPAAHSEDENEDQTEQAAYDQFGLDEDSLEVDEPTSPAIARLRAIHSQQEAVASHRFREREPHEKEHSKAHAKKKHHVNRRARVEEEAEERQQEQEAPTDEWQANAVAEDQESESEDFRFAAQAPVREEPVAQQQVGTTTQQQNGTTTQQQNGSTQQQGTNGTVVQQNSTATPVTGATQNNTVNTTLQQLQQQALAAVIPSPPSVPETMVTGVYVAKNAVPSVQASDCYTWSKRQTANVVSKDTRMGHYSFLNTKRDTVFMFGGCASGTRAQADCTSRLITRDLRKQTVGDLSIQINNPMDAFSEGSAFADVTVNNRKVVFDFGGVRMHRGEKEISSSLGVLEESEIGQWSYNLVVVAGDVPSPRRDATLTPIGTILVLIGGANKDGQPLDDVYYLETASKPYTWYKVNVSASIERPAARSGHTATVQQRTNSRIFVYGGMNTQVLGDLWMLRVPKNYSTEPFKWYRVTPLAPSFGPPALAFQSAVMLRTNGDKLIIFGGQGNSSISGETYVLDMNTMTWVKVASVEGKGIPGAYQSAVIVGDTMTKILVTGGSVRNVLYNIHEPRVLDTVGVCPNSCGANGVYSTYDHGVALERPVCLCNSGYSGKFCTQISQCEKNCNGRGQCVNGQCQCQLGFGGTSCEKPICPNNCGGPTQGYCSLDSQKCVCLPGFWGLDCTERDCPNGCSGVGICQKRDSTNPDPNLRNNWCLCDPGFSGPDCSVWGVKQSSTRPGSYAAMSMTPHNSIYDRGFSCVNNCKGHGRCKPVQIGTTVVGRCECEQGFAGVDCSGECSMHCMSEQQGKCVGDDPVHVKCQCSLGFQGVGCFDTYCANNCSNNGVCVGNQCACISQSGWTGAACQLDERCSGRGTFTNFKCSCPENWGGINCETPITCPGGCGSHGKCMARPGSTSNIGQCQCEAEYTGPNCLERTCPNSCSGRGFCNSQGACECYSGYDKADCSVVLTCPNNCTGTHGRCVADYSSISVNLDQKPGLSDGVCVCNDGWSGPDCNKLGCKDNCNGHGTCEDGRCRCDDGYSGALCEITCPSLCSKNGICTSSGKCSCFPGFSGEDCNKAAVCPGSDTPTGPCGGSERGVCFVATGKCFCAPGHAGPDCMASSTCGVLGCSGHGECKNGKCWCNPGWAGDDCEIKSGCPNDCSNHGVCLNGKCSCCVGWSGDACETKEHDYTCPKNCTGRGVCDMGSCYCAPGYSGPDCSEPVGLPKCKRFPNSQPCEGKGICEFGRCFCNPGYEGTYCHAPESCKQGCVAGQGVCQGGVCRCFKGYDGPDCSEDARCPGSGNGCSSRGLCVAGECACYYGYGGPACEEMILPEAKHACPNNCTGNGACLAGQCFCLGGHSGADCSIVTQDACPDACSGNGICKGGRCFCDPGFGGVSCAQKLECEKSCYENGVCHYGRCICPSRWKGPNCDIPSPPEEEIKRLEDDITQAVKIARELALSVNGTVDPNVCPQGCNMRGVCVNGKCACHEGFGGATCDIIVGGPLTTRCTNSCNGRGKCLFGICYCNLGWGGLDCGIKVVGNCINGCNGRGICHYGVCYCNPGFEGTFCERQTSCDPACVAGGHGVCVKGECACVKNFAGKNCEQYTGVGPAPVGQQQTSARPAGTARLPVSSVTQALAGLNECDLDCGDHGVCVRNKCFCEHGYGGSDCAIAVNSIKGLPSHLADDVGALSLMARDSLAASSGSHQMSNFLLALLSFAAGVVSCVIVQVVWEKHKEQQRKQAASQIFKPLISTLEQ